MCQRMCQTPPRPLLKKPSWLHTLPSWWVQLSPLGSPCALVLWCIYLCQRHASAGTVPLTCSALQVQAWRDMLPYAQRLCEEGVRPRHIHILLAWLKIHHAPVDNNHIADVVLSDRFMAPAVHVSNELHHVPQPNVPKSHRPAPEANPFAAAEAEAEDVTFAQLLSFITESPETRALADRALEVAAAEHRLLNALEAVKQRVVQAEVEFSAYRTFGAFVIINGPEVGDASWLPLTP